MDIFCINLATETDRSHTPAETASLPANRMRRMWELYGSNVWHSTSKYRRIIWQCNHKYKSGVHYETPHLYEAVLQQAFVDAFNSLISNKDEILPPSA